MKRLMTLAIVFCALLWIATPAPAAETCTTTLAAGSDIQAAITAANPGDVICLSPGVYSPAARIDITKSITLQGPQADVDPRPSTGTTRTPGDASSEAIIDGSGDSLSRIFYIDADNVVINGIEVKSGTGDMIRQSNAHSGTVIKYNIIHDGNGDEGIQLTHCTGCTVEYNHVYDIATPGDAVNISSGSTDGLISHNEIHDIGSENAAIYIYGATNTTIQCNLVYHVTQNDGIKLGSKNGDDASLTGGSILYNIVRDTAQDGISVYTSHTLVEGNEIHNSRSENGAIYLAFGISNITIAHNDVHDNSLDTGKWGDPGAIMIGTAVDAASVTVNYNNITNNSVNGVTNKAAALLNAENNWWGAADGPSGAGSGSGDSVSTNVDFDPWLTEPQVLINPCEPPQVIEVEIDIKPGSDPNSINLKSKGVVPVAVLTTDDFDASNVDPTTVLFAGASPVRWTLEDVDGDGDMDMLFHFKTQELGLDAGSTEATLTGDTVDGQQIEGTDSVNIVPKSK
ncbi:MAG: hypothetical protein Kow0063_11710 [Anaerolineae bacterium]